MTEELSFFMSGEASDPAYVFTRDDELGATSKEFVEDLWKRYRPYADENCRSDACGQFLQRFWEMYLAVTMLEKGFKLTKHAGDGPEFYTHIDCRRTWFEAIAPTGGAGVDCVPKLAPDEPRAVPIKQILLRFTNALDEKKKKYCKAVKDGVIGPKDAYVLAINSRGVHPDPGSATEVPYFIQAFLGIGGPAVAIGPSTRQVLWQGHQHRDDVVKISGAQVSTHALLDGDGAFCSAIIGSAVNCANYPKEMGADFSVLLNGLADNSLGISAFPWWPKYWRRDQQLYRAEPRVAGAR